MILVSSGLIIIEIVRVREYVISLTLSNTSSFLLLLIKKVLLSRLILRLRILRSFSYNLVVLNAIIRVNKSVI